VPEDLDAVLVWLGSRLSDVARRSGPYFSTGPAAARPTTNTGEGFTRSRHKARTN